MEIKKKQISAQIVADSINPQGNRITTFLLTYPRFIHGELMTHRVFSRNSASSRAIPFEKMVKMVQEDPFIPIAWQKDHKGMQGSEYITGDISQLNEDWLKARDNALFMAKDLHDGSGVTKQLCNRLLEPFMWHTVLITSTEFENWFELRCPKYLDPSGKSFKSKKDYRNNSEWSCWEGNENDILGWLEISDSAAEIHIQALAETMWDVMNESIPNQLQAGEWHIPFKDKINIPLDNNDGILTSGGIKEACKTIEYHNLQKVKIATARCARLSYITFDGKIDYEKDIQLHDSLLSSHHMSPFEHCARAMTEDEYYQDDRGIGLSDRRVGWCNNFRGFIQYRYLVENK